MKGTGMFDCYLDLFDTRPSEEQLADGAWLLRGFARGDAPILLAEVERVTTAAPFRHLTTPGGFRMSVAMSNCGALGWVSDRRGYRSRSGSDPARWICRMGR